MSAIRPIEMSLRLPPLPPPPHHVADQEFRHRPRLHVACREEAHP